MRSAAAGLLPMQAGPDCGSPKAIDEGKLLQRKTHPLFVPAQTSLPSATAHVSHSAGSLVCGHTSPCELASTSSGATAVQQTTAISGKHLAGIASIALCRSLWDDQVSTPERTTDIQTSGPLIKQA